MPMLDWIGKSKVINHHQEVPYCVLERRYSYGDADSGNMIIHGDNLDALKALLPRYEGQVKCAYADVPYNTGNEGWFYNDNVNDPKIRKWLGEVVGKEGEDLTRHDKWLCMMYLRLRLLYKLLSDDGVIFISINELVPLSGLPERNAQSAGNLPQILERRRNWRRGERRPRRTEHLRESPDCRRENVDCLSRNPSGF